MLINRVDSKIISVTCPSCEHFEKIDKKELKAKQCPSCNIKIVSLDGFYDKKQRLLIQICDQWSQ